MQDTFEKWILNKTMKKVLIDKNLQEKLDLQKRLRNPEIKKIMQLRI